MKLDPNAVFLAILRYLPAIVTIVVAVVFIYSFRVVIITGEIERTNIETAENIFSSELTYDRAVFDAKEIENMIQKANTDFYGEAKIKQEGLVEPEPNIEPEWIARHCRIAYRAEIEDLTTKKKWAFGYVPDYSEAYLESRLIYPSSILLQSEKGRGYEDVHAAQLTLTTRETWLSRIGCMIEEAYEFREPRITEVPCLYESRTGATDASGVARPGKALCLMEIRKSDANGKHVCIHKPSFIYSGFNEVAECRYFPKNINLVDSSWFYDKDGSTKKLTVYPVEETVGQLNEKELREKCESLDIKYKATPPPEVKDVNSVILCIR
ncbi:MAG: hypothetical protein HY514_00405 [Candidatus Aenigmarchaeota archaeon]|nr:hypothetical protein [Candidatus Aenigmarchaeota archaeon]